uniref:C2H2-type domain-containing protein n=1 Tax=viral metagenome TaxID=1070528 RepID=A0A6C0ITK1_9ZZZZ
MKQSETKKVAKVALPYICKTCDYFTPRKSSYYKHLATDKHQLLQLETHLKQNETKVAKSCKQVSTTSYMCDKCETEFKSRTTHWRHKKTCTGEIKNSDENSSDLSHFANVFVDAMKQNTELFKELIEHSNEANHQSNSLIKEISQQNTIVVEKLCELSKEKSMTNCHNTNTNTNNFNLNVYLNETCKDAMNMSEYIEMLNPQLSDLEAMIYLGFSKGTSKIFLNGLKEMDNNQKPIHCSDLKREVFYIKEANQWQKDSDNNNILLVKAIRQIINKNIRNIIEWQKTHPEYNDPDSKQNDVYNKIIMESMSGSTQEETNKNMAKIFRILAKETTINKNISE